MSMRAVDLVVKKRNGVRLEREELAYLVAGAVDGSIPDYQLSAWLMAVCWRGMTDEETTDLTLEMAASGTINEPRAAAGGRLVVDKHSTGGVGDKASLVVAPLVAACGVPVAKLTGRGLGHTGGTVDKLEAITGFRSALSNEEFLRLLHRHDLAIAGQSGAMAPADGVLYALRDATGTVESIPLIASSIMSKKLAGGAHAILLDVKVGSGAFMRRREDAEQLARLMVSIGQQAGRRVHAVLSNMEQPLGNAVGNALELKESIATLRGEGPADLQELSRHEAVELLLLAGRANSPAQAAALVEQTIRSGAALAKLAEVVAAQDGDAEQVLKPERLPVAQVIRQLPSPRRGHISRIDALRIGLAAVRLGAGRETKSHQIRHDVGIVLHHKVGDEVEEGEPLLEIHATSQHEVERVVRQLLRAYVFSDDPVASLPVLLG